MSKQIILDYDEYLKLVEYQCEIEDIKENLLRAKEEIRPGELKTIRVGTINKKDLKKFFNVDELVIIS